MATIYQFLRKAAKSRAYVSMFHASLTDETKRAVYHNFTSESSPLCCLVGTVAFGMVSTTSIKCCKLQQDYLIFFSVK